MTRIIERIKSYIDQVPASDRRLGSLFIAGCAVGLWVVGTMVLIFGSSSIVSISAAVLCLIMGYGYVHIAARLWPWEDKRKES